ncbi:hypothetical protein [Cellulophaga baltica]|uniref:hypothetical protein n=1 Tax=Cellulophaga baltica TaxID=76594 RepID=UPI002493E719|nr:hypothetical protein [Cellulophaga baltica]
MTEEYISGYLECVSRVKDIYTPNLGGFNCFFGIERKNNQTIKKDLFDYLDLNKIYYDSTSDDLEEIKSQINLVEITDWTNTLIPLIEKWTCDKILEKEQGKNGYYLSEYLIRLLQEFLPKKSKLYKLNPDWTMWPWGDHMSEEYLFETDEKFYILHFGESS